MDGEQIKIAYMVLCHKNAEQINRMIRSLKTNNDDFFLHIDKKTYEIKKEIVQDDYIHILSYDESFDVKWGHISMVYAVLTLIKKILSDEKKYDYIWLISGQDFPIKTRGEIDKVLQNKGCHIQMKKCLKWNKRNHLYWPECLISRTQFTRILRRVYVEISGGYSKTFKIFKRPEIGQEIYFGASWWALPYECIKEMISFNDNKPELLSYFSHSLCPDECFFQTLFNMTTFKQQNREILTYVDWTEGGNSPKILTMSDLTMLERSSCLMARKFDENICDKVLGELEMLVKEKR